MGIFSRKQEFRFTGWHMLASMLAFFGVIIGVNLTMARFAVSSWTGLVVKNSYVASQHFNAQLASAAAQNKRGWKSNLSYTQGTLSFTLHDRDGSALLLDQIKVTLGRPVFEQQDKMLALNLTTNGTYETQTELGAGIWAIRISALSDGKSYRRDERFLVDSHSNGVLQ